MDSAKNILIEGVSFRKESFGFRRENVFLFRKRIRHSTTVGIAILYCTHIINMAFRMCESFAIMFVFVYCLY